MLPVASEAVPAEEREVAALMMKAGAMGEAVVVKVVAEVASMLKVAAMEEVVVVQAEAMEVVAGAWMMKASATDVGVGASKRLAAANMAAALKAFDPRETSKSGKGGLRVC